MVQRLPATDVVIVGLGAAGGVASGVLTAAGLKVVGLEAGDYNTVNDYLAEYDELEGFYFKNTLGEAKVNHEVPTWRPNPSSPNQPLASPWRMANGVGGSSVHWTGQSWRYREDDFLIRTSTVERYGMQALPTGSTVVDWPITYQELEPYYEQVEHQIGVAGAGGTNPFESPRAADYPMPPLRQVGALEWAYEAMSAAGYHPFPSPAAITSVDYEGRPACSYCGYCTGFGCWNDSKSSSLVTTIRAAEATGNLEIRTRARVTQILTDDQGRATGVVYVDAEGSEIEQPASAVIVSTYVYENNRLLMLSTSDSHPDGIGNSTGQLGKHYSAHAYVGAYGVFPGRNFNVGSGTGAQSVAMDDFNGDNFDHSDLGFIRGAVVNFSMAESAPIALSRNVAPGRPQWGSAYKRYLKEDVGSVFSFFGQLEVLTYEDNFLDLDPDAVDQYGIPRIRVTFELKDNELAAGTFLSEKLEALARDAGATDTWSTGAMLIPVNSHAYGGTRMGTDPATSVTNRYGQVHDVPNLLVLGGSNFPSITGYNPTETIYAHSWYAAEHLANTIGAIGR